MSKKQSMNQSVYIGKDLISPYGWNMGHLLVKGLYGVGGTVLIRYYLPKLGQWYNVRSICWLLAIDQCFCLFGMQH